MRPLRHLALILGAVACAACGDSTGPRVQTPNYVLLHSDAGDYVGDGQSWSYDQTNSTIAVSMVDGSTTIRIAGDEDWNAWIQPVGGRSRLEPGEYTEIPRYPSFDPAKRGFYWSRPGRFCSSARSDLLIDSVRYDDDVLVALDLSFEQHCNGAAPALRGTVHWRAGDETRPPGPVTPIPSDLWQPASGATPATGDYVYLESDAGDYIGAGKTYLYTAANATIALELFTGGTSITVGDWVGRFMAMTPLTRLQLGYYPDAGRLWADNPARGRLSWHGEGRGCSELTGWFAVDRVTYSGNSLTALELRFEQHCEGLTPALRGKIRWTA